MLKTIADPNALKEAIRQEKMFGRNGTRRDSNFRKFAGPYLLVEEPSGAYKPISVKEYSTIYDSSNPPWPKLRFEFHSSQSVFALKSPDNEGS